MSYAPLNNIKISDDQLDAFGNLQVAAPEFVFDSQFTYDLQPLLWEQIVTGTGSVAWDDTNRLANLTTGSANGAAHMQTFEHFRYQAGRAQQVFVTFNFNKDGTAASGNTYSVGYTDGTDGVEFVMDATSTRFQINTSTDAGSQSVAQASWNLDPLNGSGPSGYNLDTSKTNILVFDLQALYVGRVRCGFDIDGVVVWAHEFKNANVLSEPYFATANLPVRAGVTAVSGSDVTMDLICCTVMTRGGQINQDAYEFCQYNTAAAVSNTFDHFISIRPKDEFGEASAGYRAKIIPEGVALYNAGTGAVRWQLCIGQALTGAGYSSGAGGHATNSGVEYTVNGTLGSSAGKIVIAEGFAAATSNSKDAILQEIRTRYPITLDAAGANRDLGTLTLLTYGIGATPDIHATLSWKEVR